jgi:rubrerythrin
MMSATTGIDFATLSLQDALDLAILIEEEARERYEEFADQMDLHHTPEAARFFRFMAGNEEKHRRALAARRHERFGDAPSLVTRSMIFDVEAPDYDEARAFMTARAALAAALRSEEKAHAFFLAALPRLKDPDVRILFEELQNEEVEHQELVRRQLAAAPPDPELSGDDLADDPVGH